MNDIILTGEIILQYDFTIIKSDSETITWYNNFNILQDKSTKKFTFELNIEGYGNYINIYDIDTLRRLKKLYKGITGRKLMKSK